MKGPQPPAQQPPPNKAGEEILRRILALIPEAAEVQRSREDPSFQLSRREERVDLVVRMMTSGNWVAGLSHQQLSDAWGCTVSAVESYAAEAHRNIRLFVRTSPEEMREQLARLIQNFERLAQKAEVRGSKNGYRDAIEANKFLAQLYGLAPTKVELDDHRAPPFEQWSDEELERFTKTGERPRRR
jgi:hypothetical protein